MEVHFKPETEAAINRVAANNQSNADEYVQQLVEAYLDHDSWFREKVREGIAAADRGDLIEHEDVRKLIDSWFPA
jgi:predicted transcriptional regulator